MADIWCVAVGCDRLGMSSTCSYGRVTGTADRTGKDKQYKEHGEHHTGNDGEHTHHAETVLSERPRTSARKVSEFCCLERNQASCNLPA